MPDLGSYALPVLTAYGTSLGLILVLVIASVVRGRRVRAQLDVVERKGG